MHQNVSFSWQKHNNKLSNINKTHQITVQNKQKTCTIISFYSYTKSYILYLVHCVKTRQSNCVIPIRPADSMTSNEWADNVSTTGPFVSNLLFSYLYRNFYNIHYIRELFRFEKMYWNTILDCGLTRNDSFDWFSLMNA